METGTPGFPLLGEPLAVDLVNTVVTGGAGPRDLLPTPEALDAWRRAQAGRLPPQSSGAPADGRLLAEVQALRAALGALFAAALAGGAPPAEAVAAVNAAADAAPASLRLVWPAAGPPLAEVRHHAPHPSGALLAAVAASGVEVLSGEDRLRLRRCQGPGCVLLFVAANPRRRWCSPVLCGNRVRVARHYRRHRGDRPGRAAPTERTERTEPTEPTERRALLLRRRGPDL
jgi:predicted RNA-binding Zn ribbon-like protein